MPFPDSLVSLADPKKHAANRKLFNPLFPPASIDGVIPSLLENIDQFGELLAREHKSGDPVNIQALFHLLGTIRDLLLDEWPREEQDVTHFDQAAAILLVVRPSYIDSDWPYLSDLATHIVLAGSMRCDATD
ncbi:hypothetical protein N7445_006156 [Penicillium cf. griseofulvum]|nr:hypothetical protein N7445_006156 [Penicillium cf. griseofulvum]